jgi:hypothetical protein
MLARWFAEPIFSTLKMEAICSSETSVETQRTTRRHIPEDYTLQRKHVSEVTGPRDDGGTHGHDVFVYKYYLLSLSTNIN